MKRIYTNVKLTLIALLLLAGINAQAFLTTICDNNGTAAHPVWVCITLQNVPCAQVSYIAGMTCSEQYFAVPPTVVWTKDGKAFLNNKGVLTQIASDQIRRFFLEKNGNLSKEERKLQFRNLLKTDDGKVSPETIHSICKELNAKLIRSDRSPIAITHIALSANAGKSSSAGISNNFNLNPNLGLELSWGGFGIGVDAGLFTTKPNFNFDTYSDPLKNQDFATIVNHSSNWNSTYILAGPQYTIGRHTPFQNKITATLSLKGGITANKTPDFVVTNKNTNIVIASYAAPADYKKTAFTVKPGIAVGYALTKTIGINANAQYLMQLGTKEFATGYKDLSHIKSDLNSQETQFQIASAPAIKTNTKGPDRYFSAGLGLSYAFSIGRKKSAISNNKLSLDDTPNTSECCRGSKWIGNVIRWELTKDAKELISADIKMGTNPAAKLNPLTTGSVDLSAPVKSGTGTIQVKCDTTYRFQQGSKYTFFAAYACNPSEKCTSKVRFTVSGPISIDKYFSNAIPNPETIVFNIPGTYTVHYDAYCGEEICNRCQYTIVVDKNCCPAVKSKTSTIAVRDFKGKLSVAKATSFPPIQTYTSFGAVAVNLNYTCPEGCAATYTWTRQHKAANGQFINVVNGGGTGSSPLSIPVPQSGTDRIIISVKCGDQVCGSAVEIFNLENYELKTSGAALEIPALNPSDLPECASCETTVGNLVTNGNFSNGNTGFLSDFPHDEYGSEADSYRVSQWFLPIDNNTNKYIRICCTYINHNKAFSGKLLWKNAVPIPVVASKKYSLCLKLRNPWRSTNATANALSTPGYPEIACDVLINGTVVATNLQVGQGAVVIDSQTYTYGSKTDTYHNTIWKSFNTSWIATSNTAVIEVRFKSKSYPNVSGWEFGLDDIVFRECQ